MTIENQLKKIAFSLAELMDGAEPSVMALVPNNLSVLYNYKVRPEISQIIRQLF